MTDDGDGIMNEKGEGVFARTRYIGPGFMTGGDDRPTIGQTAGEIFLTTGETSATLWCSGVFDSDGIRSVTAELVPPDWPLGSIVDLALTYDDGTERYQGTYSGFTVAGDYRVLYTAEDREGNLSAEETGAVYQYSTADAYEIDDTTPEASLLVVNDTLPQSHNFHDYGDLDWARFLAVDGESYTVWVGSPGAMCDPVLVLSWEDETLGPLSILIDDAGYGEAENAIWDSTMTGPVYVQVRNYDPSDTGSETHYALEVEALYGISNGRVIDRGMDWLLLGWDPSTDPSILFYEIYQSRNSSGGYELIASLPVSASRYTDADLLSDTAYYYRIHEVDSYFNRHSLGSEFFGTTETSAVNEWENY